MQRPKTPEQIEKNAKALLAWRKKQAKLKKQEPIDLPIEDNDPFAVEPEPKTQLPKITISAPIQQQIIKRFTELWKHSYFSPNAAIRLNCLECTGMKESDIEECTMKKCFLWPWRMGKKDQPDLPLDLIEPKKGEKK